MFIFKNLVLQKYFQGINKRIKNSLISRKNFRQHVFFCVESINISLKRKIKGIYCIIKR
jgi:hypothetical protein